MRAALAGNSVSHNYKKSPLNWLYPPLAFTLWRWRDFFNQYFITIRGETMNKLIKFLKTTAYVIATILSICLVAMTMLTALAAEANEPTALEREQARIQWIAEHGKYQSNLTESAEQEAMAYTNIKQKELDYEKGENRN